jgi:hypothetical protein
MEDAPKNDLAEVGQVIKERWKIVSICYLTKRVSAQLVIVLRGQ